MTDRIKLTRRTFLAATAGATSLIAAPAILKAQTRELVVGGAASHRSWVESIVIPAFEKKYDCRVLYEGTRSLVNLEKMQQNKDRQYLSVVQMDDPVMILAQQAGLLEPLTVEKVPNLANLKPNTVHMDGAWANYLQPFQSIAYNHKELPDGVASWAELWDARFKGRLILPSLQNTEGVFPLFMAASLETGKPVSEAQYDVDAGFRKLKALKPNLLTIYTQMPQAFNLLETGEGFALAGALSSFTMPRKQDGAPIGLAAPKEGVFAAPSGVCVVKGGPQQDLAFAYVNELLGADMQSKLVGPTFSLPTNTAVAAPDDLPKDINVLSIDWANVAKNRQEWVQRWDREMGL